MATGASVTLSRTQNVNLSAIVAKLKEEKTRVLIGIPMGVVEASGESVAVIAAKNEFGSPAERIPERPFLRVGVQNSRDKYTALGAKQLPNVLNGTIGIDDLLGMLGALAVGSVQKQIRNGTYRPNSAYTIALKGSSKPLIDTGQMWQSITWVIERNGAY